MMNRRQFIRTFSVLMASTSFFSTAPGVIRARSTALPVAGNTEDVPRSAWPWVYNFWLNGNVTKEGITADLEAMNQSGIGGMLFMDGALGNPNGGHRFMEQSWLEHFNFMLAEARRLGLQVKLNNGPGWSGSPGPWNTAENASQKVIYTYKTVTGPAVLDDALLPPGANRPPSYDPAAAGANYPALTDNYSKAEVPIGQVEGVWSGVKHDHYHDIAVLAFPLDHGTVPDFRIPEFNSTKSFSGDTDFAGVVPWPRFIPTDPDWPELPDGESLAKDDARDLLAEAKDGKWKVPEGDWLVMRFGHTVAAGGIRAAQHEAAGFECDKLSKRALEAHFAQQVSKLADKPTANGKRAVVATHIDSWEAGSGNWTAGFREEFERRRGYDLQPYLPTLAGFAVNGREESERFLWDFRETIAELMLENYAGHMAELAHRKGLTLSIEAYDGTCDDLRYAGRADEPMSEFWRGCYSGLALQDLSELAASAGHVYGKPIIGAEAFTAFRGDFLDTPETLKPLADWAFCIGINKLNYTEWIQQPWPDVAPGVSFANIGTLFHQNVTWWPMSGPFHKYIARCQQMLREGTFVADICFVTPEGAPYRFTPPVPATQRGVHPSRSDYGYDGCPAELVLNNMRVKGGKVILDSGMEYRLLVLPTYDAGGVDVIRLIDDGDYTYKPMPMPRVKTMTPELLRQVKTLAEQGATIVGYRPHSSPSLMGYPDCDREVRKLADAIWGEGAGDSDSGERRIGKGRVIWGRSTDEILRQDGVPADFAPLGSLAGKLNYIHRRTEDGKEIYFVVNKQAGAVFGTGAFRVEGKQPKLLWPDTGEIKNVEIYGAENGVTRIPLALASRESVFIIFEPTDAQARQIVSITRGNERVWPAVEATDTNDEGDDSFILAGWKVPAGIIPMPSQTAAGLAYDNKNLKLGGGSFSTMASPGQARAGVSYGANGIVVWRYNEAGIVEPLIAYEKPMTDPVHIGVLYENRIARLFLNGELIGTSARLNRSLNSISGPDDHRFFAGELAALEQFEDMLAAQGIEHGMGAVSDHPEVDMTRGLIWESGDYTVSTASGEQQIIKGLQLPEQTLEGPWDVAFDPEWGGPEQVKFDTLDDWSQRPEEGIRHYSGAAVYRKRFDLQKPCAAGSRIFIDLGKVAGLAEVSINGHSLGILWTPPRRFDVTDHLKANDNILEIRVINRWVNRMIGDEKLPPDVSRNAQGIAEEWPEWLTSGQDSPTGRFTFASFTQWKATDPLVKSGLLGPVRLVSAHTI